MASVSVHQVDSESFEKIKEAFPWLYKKSHAVEWVALKFDNITVTYFRKW